MANEETWASFEKEWSAALGMSPRLTYFKETEANGRSGEFAGWSDQSFADRMHLLVRIIADHNLFGLISAVPTKLYFEVFGKNPDRVLAYPYFFMIHDLVSRMGFWLEKTGYKGKVQFIFDEQKGQEEAVSASWPRLLKSAPPNVRPLLSDYPIFRSDKTTMALQAADFCAGQLRRDLRGKMVSGSTGSVVHPPRTPDNIPTLDDTNRGCNVFAAFDGPSILFRRRDGDGPIRIDQKAS